MGHIRHIIVFNGYLKTCFKQTNKVKVGVTPKTCIFVVWIIGFTSCHIIVLYLRTKSCPENSVTNKYKQNTWLHRDEDYSINSRSTFNTFTKFTTQKFSLIWHMSNRINPLNKELSMLNNKLLQSVHVLLFFKLKDKVYIFLKHIFPIIFLNSQSK